jgi:hypothetical protein
MAGNYRSHGGGITRAIARGVDKVRSTHNAKQTLAKNTEAAKQVVSHREKAKGEQARATITAKADAIAKITKTRGSEARRTATHKNKLKTSRLKNDTDAKKKQPSAPKKQMVAKDKKW